MPRPPTASVLVVALLAAAVAGCATGPDPDQPGDDGSTSQDPEPSCVRGPEYQWSALFGQPERGRMEQCWINVNGSANASSPFYFVIVRDRGSGSWNVTVEDGAGDVFLDVGFGPAPNYRCDDQGREAAPGNWTVSIRYRNFTGNPTVRIDAEEPEDDEWQCIDG